MTRSIRRSFIVVAVINVVVAGLLSVSCRPTQEAVPTTVPILKPTEGVEPPNFILHVLNVSQKRESIDIVIYIDGDLEISDTFDSGGSDLIISIPPRKTYRFRLTEGVHTIKAVSAIGEASLEEQFEISDTHWAILGYEYFSGFGSETPPKHFQFFITDEPIYFQ
jgi:hypothetical protein